MKSGPRAFEQPLEEGHFLGNLVNARECARFAAQEAFRCLSDDGLGVLRSHYSRSFRWNEDSRAVEAELIAAGFVEDDKLTPWGRFVLFVGAGQ